MQNFESFLIEISTHNKYMPSEYLDEIFHYTSPSSFESILFGNKNNAIFRASRYDCLNDISEGSVAFDVFKNVCKKMYDNNKLSKEKYCFLKNIKPSTKKLMQHHPYKYKMMNFDTFICSFSMDSDSLPMWNYYSKNNKYEGYNIGIYSESMYYSLAKCIYDKRGSFRVFPVVYEEQEQSAFIETALNDVLKYFCPENEQIINNCISEMILDWSVIFKNKCFEHENEVRVIIQIPKDEENNNNIPTVKINYRLYQGYIIPYIDLELDKSCIKSVTIGPLSCDEKSRNTQTQLMQQLLKSSEYSISVLNSSIPIRY